MAEGNSKSITFILRSLEYELKTKAVHFLCSHPGDKYWVFNGNEVLNNSPRSISDYGLPHYVRKIDAIMVWERNKKTYIFSGDQFWRFNETSHLMDPGYPKSIQLFKGVPPNLDSAMTWSDGMTYFFKDNLYWAFNNTWLKTEPFYPQDASKYWLGCQ